MKSTKPIYTNAAEPPAALVGSEQEVETKAIGLRLAQEAISCVKAQLIASQRNSAVTGRTVRSLRFTDRRLSVWKVKNDRGKWGALGRKTKQSIQV